MLGKPHQQTPDIDNLSKAFMDCMSSEDCAVYMLAASKYWDDHGHIEVVSDIPIV